MNAGIVAIIAQDKNATLCPYILEASRNKTPRVSRPKTTATNLPSHRLAPKTEKALAVKTSKRGG